MRIWLHNIWHSLVLRLVLLHFREHFILMVLWLVLLLILEGQILSLFGIRLLLLRPEYFGVTGPMSYAILGTAVGALIMTWNLVTYLLYVRRFPFLATLSRPFTVFSLNNAVVPGFVLVYYVLHIIWFHHLEVDCTPARTLANTASFIAGVILVILIIFAYLGLTNKDIRQFPGIAAAFMRREKKKIARQSSKHNWNVENYLSTHFHIRRVRSTEHYAQSVINKIYRQNHINVLLLQVLCLVGVMILGRLADFDTFRVPAGASLLLLFSITFAFIGGVSYWFGPWRFVVFIGLIFMIEFQTSHSKETKTAMAFGLDYSSKNVPHYTNEAIASSLDPSGIEADRRNMQRILMNWKDRQKAEKPLLIILSASGGGLKAAHWTMHVMQQIDRMMQRELLLHTPLMTGASGGVFALAYYRSLYQYAHHAQGVDITSDTYLNNISKDVLNSTAFSLVSTDIFRINHKFKDDDGQIYVKDRGFYFEKQLSENTGHLMDKRLKDYFLPEKEARIPMLLITPTIINDGRRLVISPQGVRHLCMPPGDAAFDADGIDFVHFFKSQKPADLKMTSALRMNAGFPFILPSIALPSQPKTFVMDAGIRDNFGVSVAARFLSNYKDWIMENTAGVLHIQIRCWEKTPEINDTKGQGLIRSIFQPFGLLGQQSKFQDFEQDLVSSMIKETYGPDKLHIIRFIYEPQQKNQPASLSFHLTDKEKSDILKAWHTKENQESFHRVLKLYNGMKDEPQTLR